MAKSNKNGLGPRDAIVTEVTVRKRWLIAIGVVLVLLIAGFWLASPALSRYVKSAVIRSLQQSGQVEIQQVQVAVFPSLTITIDGIQFHHDGRTDVPPLISIGRAALKTNWIALITKHVGEVRLTGLRIQVPPRHSGSGGGLSRPQQKKQSGFVVDRMIADGAVLLILPKDPLRDPLEWDMRQLTLHHVGTDDPMRFETILENAKPPGEIHSTGNFGPWQFDDPAETPVSGDYTFRDADLSVFTGISGILSSDGKYAGVLDSINVDGTTDTPDFAVRVSGLPVHLKTQFHAVVDGSNGNTYLQPVLARFGRTSIDARGAVEGQPNVRGQSGLYTQSGPHGKTISLDVQVQNGRLEDLLRLAVKSDKPILTGGVNFRARMVIPAGDIDIARKLRLDGAFDIRQSEFSQLSVQEKVDELSHRASGDPKAPADDRVASNFHGRFNMKSGDIRFPDLTFTVPGANIDLSGDYGIIDQHIDFHGTARMDAKVSQMTTGFKSFLLKAVDPFFQKKHAGAVLPIKIEGTRESPKFGLELRRKK